MATIDKRESGRYQAKIRRIGFPMKSKMFATRKEAEAWAKVVESEMVRGAFIDSKAADKMLFEDAADYYTRKILPTLRGADRDIYRIRQLVSRFGAYSVTAITPVMIEDYKDERLEYLSAQSVLHEINMLTRIYKAISGPRGIQLPRGIPTVGVTRPTGLKKRNRLLEGDEEARIFAAIETAKPRALNPRGSKPKKTPGETATGKKPPPSARGPNPYVKPLVALAIEAATRQSELISLDWKDINLKYNPWPFMNVRGVDGRATKNADESRLVTLSPRAVEILKALSPKKSGRVFHTTAAALKKSWARAKKRARVAYERESLEAKLLAAGFTEDAAKIEVKRALPPSGGRRPAIPVKPSAKTLKLLAEVLEDKFLTDLRFHDLRHEGTTRLAEKLPIHKAMKMTGHKDVKTFLVYYQQRPDDVAADMGWAKEDTEMKVPNKLTATTLAKSEQGKHVRHAKDATELFEQLDI